METKKDRDRYFKARANWEQKPKLFVSNRAYRKRTKNTKTYKYKFTEKNRFLG